MPHMTSTHLGLFAGLNFRPPQPWKTWTAWQSWQTPREGCVRNLPGVTTQLMLSRPDRTSGLRAAALTGCRETPVNMSFQAFTAALAAVLNLRKTNELPIYFLESALMKGRFAWRAPRQRCQRIY